MVTDRQFGTVKAPNSRPGTPPADILGATPRDANSRGMLIKQGGLSPSVTVRHRLCRTTTRPPGVTGCHHLSPSVTCAREKPKACFMIITGPPLGLSLLQSPQVTDGDRWCQPLNRWPNLQMSCAVRFRRAPALCLDFDAAVFFSYSSSSPTIVAAKDHGMKPSTRTKAPGSAWAIVNVGSRFEISTLDFWRTALVPSGMRLEFGVARSPVA